MRHCIRVSHRTMDKRELTSAARAFADVSCVCVCMGNILFGQVILVSLDFGGRGFF
jgi:hypothetical protein